MTPIPKLANGREPFAASPPDANGNRIVLCRLDDHFTPYVTWQIDAAGHAYSGSYHRTFEEATADFADRSRPFYPVAVRP